MPSNFHTPRWRALQCRHSDTKSFSLTPRTHATRGSAGHLVVIFAWRMPACGWIDFTSNAGFGPPVRRVETWPSPSSALQASVGDHGMSLDSRRPSYRPCWCLHGSPFSICGGTRRWLPPGQTGILMTLTVSASTDRMGSAVVTLLTIHFSDGTGGAIQRG